MLFRPQKWEIVVSVVVGSTIVFATAPTEHKAEAGLTGHTATSNKLVHDVALGERGWITGQIIDAEGQPIARELIRFQHTNGAVCHVRSNGQGRFVLNGLAGGVYHVVTKDRVTVCRLWTHRAAPPLAKSSLLLVRGETVRGQAEANHLGGHQMGLGTTFLGGIFARGLSQPWVISGLVAAGVAAPIIAVEDHDDAS